MKDLTPELIAKAKAAKSAEELLELAKENGVELTEEEAKTFFEQLHTNGAVSDDELEAVTGGGICEMVEYLFRSKDKRKENNCPVCGDKQPDKVPFETGIKTLPYNSNDNKPQIKYL